MTRVRVSRSGNVCCRAAIRLPMSAGAAWGELRDFTRYAAQDTFHAEFRIEGGIPRPGARFVVTHHFLLFSVQRVGRILRWRELDRSARPAGGPRGRPAGYSFSDLSQRGPRHGFPHTFSYYLRPAGAASCTLEVVVRGRWTARLMPRWAAWLWLRWVFGQVVMSVRNSLLLAAAGRRGTNAQSGPATTSLTNQRTLDGRGRSGTYPV
jgi:hypothetical protein